MQTSIPSSARERGPAQATPSSAQSHEPPARPLWAVAAQFAPAPRRTVSPRHHGTLAAVGRCYALDKATMSSSAMVTMATAMDMFVNFAVLGACCEWALTNQPKHVHQSFCVCYVGVPCLHVVVSSALSSQVLRCLGVFSSLHHSLQFSSNVSTPLSNQVSARYSQTHQLASGIVNESIDCL